MGHTPGPWTDFQGLVNGRESRPKYRALDIDAPSHDIFDAEEWPAELQDEARANARLIAAAPDLLAACEAALEELQDVPGRNEPESIDLLKAAVTKAKGEQ